MILEDKIVKLSKQLLPTGRAFRMYFDSNLEKLYKALAITEGTAYRAATSVLDAVLPDNERFTADDATDWERRLGLVSNPLVPLDDRMAAILRKMQAPGRNPAKCHYLWIEKQLQDAGFNVYVYENIYPVYPSGYTTMNPADLNAGILSEVQQGDFQQGDVQQAYYINHMVVNSINNDDDVKFDVGDSLRSTFFIGAGPNTPGVYANVLASRETEFRQLILNLKQVQNVAILFINYI